MFRWFKDWWRREKFVQFTDTDGCIRNIRRSSITAFCFSEKHNYWLHTKTDGIITLGTKYTLGQISDRIGDMENLV